MVFRSSGPTAWPLVCVLGGVLMGLPAASVQAETAAVAGVALPSEAPPELMLAKHWHAALNPGDFLVSEKLDGVRAVWDGRVLRFRSGRSIAAPGWFTAALPPTPLDGELWLGRGQFDRLSGIARRTTPVDAEWRELRYQVFDLPGAAGTFAERTARYKPAGGSRHAGLAAGRGADARNRSGGAATAVASTGEGGWRRRHVAPCRCSVSSRPQRQSLQAQALAR